VINTNLPPILRRFRDTAVDRSEIAILGYPSCLTPQAEGLPWDDLSEIFSGCQWTAKVPNAVEILPKIWTAWVGCTNVTDDRQTTDGQTIAYSKGEREFTFAKNGWHPEQNDTIFSNQSQPAGLAGCQITDHSGVPFCISYLPYRVSVAVSRISDRVMLSLGKC